MISWTEAKKHFHWDGSLRDLYVLRTSLDDWDLFLQFARESNWLPRYSEGGIGTSGPLEDAHSVFARQDSALCLTLRHSGLELCCHFFTETEIELDLDPREMQGQAQLNALLEFMRELGDALGKDVILTPENAPEVVLVRYSATQKTARIEDAEICEGQRSSHIGRLFPVLGYFTAFALTLVSLFLNNMTLASGDYKPVVIKAIGAAVIAIALIGLCWGRMPTAGRAVSLVLLLANAWTLIDAVGRRLPALL